MLPKLFSKMRIGKSNNNNNNNNNYSNSMPRQGYLCGQSRNFSDDDDDDDDGDGKSLGCLNKSTPNRTSRTGSTQTLDKLPVKRGAQMKPASSMIDLTFRKTIVNSSTRKPIFKREDSKGDYEGMSKEQKKDLKKKHKDDRLKRGYSWRQAYKTGAIPIEKTTPNKDTPNKDNPTKNYPTKNTSSLNPPSKDQTQGGEGAVKSRHKRGKESRIDVRETRNDMFVYDDSCASSRWGWVGGLGGWVDWVGGWVSDVDG